MTWTPIFLDAPHTETQYSSEAIHSNWHHRRLNVIISVCFDNICRNQKYSKQKLQILIRVMFHVTYIFFSEC